MSVQFDPVRIRTHIRESLEASASADPVLLDQYRRLFKEEVSLFRRSSLAAWLLMELDRNGQGISDQNGGYSRKGRFSGDRERLAGGEHRAPTRTAGGNGETPRSYPLPEEESIRLFISVGRSRRLFPREILGLILSNTQVSRDDIGTIRILDNYSFVQVRNGVAERIIEALNGKSFRGRALVVNYARTKKEGDSADGPAGETPPGDARQETDAALETGDMPPLLDDDDLGDASSEPEDESEHEKSEAHV